jgi:hypothetical protein
MVMARLVRGRRAGRASAEERMLRLAQLRLALRVAREDLVVLAQRLDDCPPWLAGRAEDEWKLAAGRYAAARASLTRVGSLADVLHVHSELREAWFHLARSDAFAYDEPPPSSSEPCFFDPRHGPAVTDVQWLDEGVVRACRDDADRVAAGLAPRRRLLTLTAFTDPTDTSAWQRLMAAHARGGGYATGALYAGRPDPLLV